MTERMAHFRIDAMEAPREPVEDTGWSDFAIHSGKAWDDKDRPEGWIGGEYALVVHTTGSGLPDKAAKNGQYPTVRAENYYSQSHGCHYVNGYRGHEGGDLIQMAWEGEQANGVGTTENKKKGQKGQRQSILGKYGGNWEKDLPRSLVRRWRKRWPGYANPLDLTPGTKTVNPYAIHVECPPLTRYWIERGLKPAYPGSYFTLEQHQTIALLALDIAERKRWPFEWWRTPRLLGHEDLTPISRHIKSGAWDPGYLMESPRFDWRLVIEHLMPLMGLCVGEEDFEKLPKTRKGGPYSKY